jgi:pyruvate/2-oxoglutarate dehydrogenase complex dihydrolipoamide acyltransferase (E2) component
VKRGSAVAERESVVEVLCGGVTVDLPSPTAGVLKKKLAADGDVLTVGQPLAVIE